MLGKGSTTHLHTQPLSSLILPVYSITWKHHLLGKGKFNYRFNEDPLRDTNKNATSRKDWISQQYICLTHICSTQAQKPVDASESECFHHHST